MNVGMVLLYGWGEKSERVDDYVSDVCFRCELLIVMFSLDGINVFMVYKGVLGCVLFGFYVVNVFVSMFNEGDVLFLDSLFVCN